MLSNTVKYRGAVDWLLQHYYPEWIWSSFAYSADEGRWTDNAEQEKMDKADAGRYVKLPIYILYLNVIILKQGFVEFFSMPLRV